MTSDPSTSEDICDLFIIGGGINGVGIARDAVGRGLSVTLAEMADFGGATSSASTKLFHGGLRYLEYFETRLVREALREREVLLRAMPHIAKPMRFVLPFSSEMRFENATPTSRLLGALMPWMKGRRPAWLIRFGLFLYDHLGGRKILPGTRRVDLSAGGYGAPLQDRFRFGWEYSDCWVDDARLVILNARDAAARGARLLPRTRVVSARRDGAHWLVETRTAAGVPGWFRARALVNAAGPWVGEVLEQTVPNATPAVIRLVRGSHIVVPRLYDHDRAYFFQGEDGRIIFSIPYEDDFTVIGTTDADHNGEISKVHCTETEAQYLCDFASSYFKVPVTRDQVVWTYSGVRPLYDDGASSSTAATREYVLRVDRPAPGAAPLLNVFGGKITTYRRLAEAAMAKLRGDFPALTGDWTAGVALPGGDLPWDGRAALAARLRAAFPFLDEARAARFVRLYGTEAFTWLDGATSAADLGEEFGAGLSAREVNWLIEAEYAQTAEDILWRRTKLGLVIGPEGAARLADYLQGLGLAA